jgi:hypothetical protein
VRRVRLWNGTTSDAPCLVDLSHRRPCPHRHDGMSAHPSSGNSWIMRLNYAGSRVRAAGRRCSGGA